MTIRHPPGRQVLWSPTAADLEGANETRFRVWLETERGLTFDDYPALWRWSVDRLEDFWQSIWDYFGLRSPNRYRSVLDRRRMPGARWFAGAKLNYAQEMLERASDSHPAIVGVAEGGEIREVSLATLRREVASLAANLRAVASGPGIGSSPICRTAPKRWSACWPRRRSARSGRSAGPTSG